MKVECIVSTLVVVDVPDGSSDGIIEALAKHEFFGQVIDLNPEKLHVEITDWVNSVPSAPKDS